MTNDNSVSTPSSTIEDMDRKIDDLRNECGCKAGAITMLIVFGVLVIVHVSGLMTIGIWRSLVLLFISGASAKVLSIIYSQLKAIILLKRKVKI